MNDEHQGELDCLLAQMYQNLDAIIRLLYVRRERWLSIDPQVALLIGSLRATEGLRRPPEKTDGPA